MFSPDQFVAHRGYTAHYPENTLTAFTAAIKAGATHIELDIQFSRDGIPMVYHDVDLQRVSGITGSIFDFNANELDKLCAYEPERLGKRFKGVPISRAEELAHLIHIKSGVHFYLELKEESIERFTASYCLETLHRIFAPVMNQCTLISFDLPAMKMAKTDFHFPQTGIVLRDWEKRNTLIKEYLADIAYINIKRIPKDEPIVAICPIVTYEIADVALAANTLKRGASKIETYDIGELIGALCKTNTTL
jgi:glycerophosphoryl diester phosphodiesterase